MSGIVKDRLKSKNKLQEPPKYHVVLTNDFGRDVGCDVTILEEVFSRRPRDAFSCALAAAYNGRSLATRQAMTQDMAQTKASQGNEAVTVHGDHNRLALYLHFIAEPM